MTLNMAIFSLRRNYLIPCTTFIAALNVPWPSPAPAVDDAVDARKSNWWTWTKSGLPNNCFKVVGDYGTSVPGVEAMNSLTMNSTPSSFYLVSFRGKGLQGHIEIAGFSQDIISVECGNGEYTDSFAGKYGGDLR